MQVNGRRPTKRNRRVVLIFTLVLSLALCGSARGNSRVRMNPGAINFHIDTKPSEPYVYSQDVLTLEWKNGADREDISYEITNLLDKETMIPASLIEAARIGVSDYQSLDLPMVFLRANEDKAQISFRIASEAWRSAGNFDGLLRTTRLNNGDINVKAHVQKYTCLDVDAGEDGIVVDANQGPGIYAADEKIGFTVFSNGKPWILSVSSECLNLSSSVPGLSQIPPENIWVRLDDEDYEINMAEGLILSGPAGKLVAHELSVRVRTELEHVSGTYKGKLKLTLSE
ncbi:MAG: hypothetical protein GX998_04400 [Firmicutes bacterium]|nr:hypothetical protein [Bacillota bacterium]